MVETVELVDPEMVVGTLRRCRCFAHRHALDLLMAGSRCFRPFRRA